MFWEKNKNPSVKFFTLPFMSMYFSYNVSNVVNELNRSSKLRKFAGFSKEIPTAEQIYEYMSRYSAEQYCKIVNSTLMRFNKQNRGTYNRFILMQLHQLVILIMTSILYQKNISKN